MSAVVGMDGLQVVIFLMSLADKLNDLLDSSRLFSSSFDILLKPDLAGGVRKGLNVLMAHASGVLVKMHLAMFRAMPGWMTRSCVGCHCVKRRAAVGPFLYLMR